MLDRGYYVVQIPSGGNKRHRKMELEIDLHNKDLVFLKTVDCFGECLITVHSSHKYHNALDSYPKMYHFITELFTHVYISAKNGAL